MSAYKVQGRLYIHRDIKISKSFAALKSLKSQTVKWRATESGGVDGG